MFKTPDGTSLALSLSLIYIQNPFNFKRNSFKTFENARASVKAPGFFCAGAL